MADDKKKSTLLPSDGKKGSGRVSGFADRARFINHSFSEDEKERLRDEVSNGFGGWELIDELLEGGYAVSLKREGVGGGVLCIVRPDEPTNPNIGLLLTGRHSTAFAAWAAAAYRHFVVSEGIWRVLDDGSSHADF